MKRWQTDNYPVTKRKATDWPNQRPRKFVALDQSDNKAEQWFVKSSARANRYA